MISDASGIGAAGWNGEITGSAGIYYIQLNQSNAECRQRDDPLAVFLLSKKY